MSLSSAQTV